MENLTISRRQALAGALVAPVAGAALLNATPAQAAAEMKGVAMTPYSRMKVGGFEVTTLLDAARTAEKPQGTFGMNVSAEEFAKVSAENFIPADMTRFYFTPVLVNTGKELVLFDTGLGGANGNLKGALASAGYTPEQVDVVVITHMHPDHIGGLMSDGSPTFANARYVTGAAENNFWTTKGKDNRVGKMVAANVTPLAEKTTYIDDGASVVSGITGMAAFGHTPGHMVYMIESDGKQLMLLADLANHYVWSLAYPEWEVRFDADKAAAAAARKKIIGMAAADKIPFAGYHLPFPAVGYAEVRGNGFRYVPATYQMQM
ncbi:MAG: MBL fold metallo-hydrolase [Pseudomonadota bacterium]